MKVRVQFCWHGGDKYSFRALTCGGVHVFVDDYKWTRRTARLMLDEICRNTNVERRNIRFVHV